MNKTFNRILVLFKEIFLIFFMVVVLVSIFPIKIASVRQNSMSPNYKEGQIIMYQKNWFKGLDIKRGDVIIIRKESKGYPSLIIKRVAALEGDTIYHDINQAIVNEDIKEDGVYAEGIIDYLEKEQYYVLGDNYWKSIDSRNFGPIGRDEIVGKVIYPKR